MNLSKVGVIGRFKPLNNLGKAILEVVCENADEVIIGIGSSNRYNSRNPFTVEETEGMIRSALHKYSNYRIVHIPDSGHLPEYRDGKKWVEDVRNAFGDLNFFMTGNDYVWQLLQDHYEVIHPFQILPKEKRRRISSTGVRTKMAKGEDWQSMVPKEVARYLQDNQLVERFRKEFGPQVLEEDSNRDETAAQEQLNIGNK